MLQALKQRAIARLWFGQALSTIGDQIYGVGITWLAVGLVGADAGYMHAGQAAAMMIFSLVGGYWADRWSPVKTMVFTDMIRAGVVLIPVVWSYFSPISLGVLWFVSLALASSSAFFEPAMQTLLPRLARDRESLVSATGLMATTFRMARMVGPTIVGLLSSVIPMIHFFTVNALTYIASAFSLNSIPAIDPEATSFGGTKAQEHGSIWVTIKSGYDAVKARPGVMSIFVVRAVNGGSWIVVMGLGLALFVREMTGSADARQFGLVMGSYGFGNFFGALFFGNIRRASNSFMIFGGYIWLGVMFVLMGFAPTIGWVMAAAAVAGFSGPMNDLGFIDMIQRRFPVDELARVTRLRIVLETGVWLFCMLLAPSLFRMFPVRAVIIACGVVYAACGVVGLLMKDATRET